MSVGGAHSLVDGQWVVRSVTLSNVIEGSMCKAPHQFCLA